MRIQEHLFTPSDLRVELFSDDTMMFLDIETAGSSRESSQIYMIGELFYSRDGWTIRQYLAETPGEETDLLKALCADLKKVHTLVTYYGEAFDLPFLQARYRIHNLPAISEDIRSYDLWKLLKPYKSAFYLPNMKQTTLESALGLPKREFPDGKKNITIYNACKKALSEHSEQLVSSYTDSLFGHNREDLRGMAAIYPLTMLRRLSDHLSEAAEFDASSLTWRFRLSQELGLPFQLETEDFSVRIDGRELLFTAIPRNGMLKMCYSNYRDYYYLPAEDRVIPKALGSSIARELRINAGPNRCYTWIPVTAAFLEDTAQTVRYARHNLSILLNYL